MYSRQSDFTVALISPINVGSNSLLKWTDWKKRLPPSQSKVFPELLACIGDQRQALRVDSNESLDSAQQEWFARKLDIIRHSASLHEEHTRIFSSSCTSLPNIFYQGLKY